MYKVNGITDFFKKQKEECSCFGPAQQEDQHFLAKHKTPPSSSSHFTIEDNINQSIKANPKKSLKRQPPFQTRSHNIILNQSFLQEKSRHPMDLNSQTCRIEPQVVPYHQEPLESYKTCKKIYQFKGKHKQFLQANAIHHFQNRVSFNSTQIMAPQVTPYHTPPLRFSFGKGFNNKAISLGIVSLNKLQLSQEENEHVSQNLKNSLEKQKEKQKTKQMHKIQSLQHINMHNQHEQDALDVQFLSRKKQNPVNSKKIEINPLKLSSSPQNKASRSSLNVEIGKSQLLNLKKMDDVIEIYSQAGSDQSESSDQSIVLGRLNQYGSMVQVKGGSTIAQKSMQSKGAGLTAISSTISLCQFNRKKDEV